MGVKILVVDDEPDLELLVRQKFRRQIREKEFEFAFAHNGLEALETLQNDRTIDLILTDINMPVMDGLTLLSKIKEINPILKAVIVSAYGDLQNIRTAMNRGAFDFLTKPIDFEDFEITVNKTLEQLMTLKEALKEHDQLIALKQELNVAARIQQSIVPRTFPPFPERTDFEILAEMIPAREVGGDFYDFFLIDKDRLGFVIGDVSGKGVPASIFMAVSRTLLKSVASEGRSPAETLQRVNHMIASESDSAMFVTIFYGVLNTATGELEYSLGGHNPPYVIYKDAGIEPLEMTGGMAVGVIEGIDYQSKKMSLKPGDTIFLYTDGVTEAMDCSGNMLGEPRTENILKELSSATLTDLIRGTISEVKNFSAGVPQSDDITVLAMRYLGR